MKDQYPIIGATGDRMFEGLPCGFVEPGSYHDNVRGLHDDGGGRLIDVAGNVVGSITYTTGVWQIDREPATPLVQASYVPPDGSVVLVNGETFIAKMITSAEPPRWDDVAQRVLREFFNVHDVEIAFLNIAHPMRAEITARDGRTFKVTGLLAEKLRRAYSAKTAGDTP